VPQPNTLPRASIQWYRMKFFQQQCIVKSTSKSSCDRRSVGQSVLVSGHHLGPATNFSFTFMENTFRHLRFSSCEAPSLTRGRVCNSSVQLLLGITSAVTLRSYPGGLVTTSYCLICDRVPFLFSSVYRNTDPVYVPL
jgi:hypothetical protein